MSDIQQDLLRKDPDFYPLSSSPHKAEEWKEVCDQVLETLSKVPVHEKPATEQALFEAQWQFYEAEGDPKAIEKMFTTMVPYISSLILKFKKNTRYISRENLTQMAQEVALRVTSQYLKRPGFLIDASFAGYAKWKILEVTGEADDFERAEQIDPVTKEKKKMPLLSLNSLIDSAKGKGTSIEDLQETLNFVNLGGDTVASATTTEMRIDETIQGIMAIVNTLLHFIEEHSDGFYDKYKSMLYATTSLHVLFSGGVSDYEKFKKNAPSTKLLTLVEETSREILQFLRESSSERIEDY